MGRSPVDRRGNGQVRHVAGRQVFGGGCRGAPLHHGRHRSSGNLASTASGSLVVIRARRAVSGTSWEAEVGWITWATIANLVGHTPGQIDGIAKSDRPQVGATRVLIRSPRRKN